MNSELITRIKTAVIFVAIYLLFLLAASSETLWLKYTSYFVFSSLIVISFYELSKLSLHALKDKRFSAVLFLILLIPIVNLLYVEIMHPDISLLKSSVFFLSSIFITGFVLIFAIYVSSRFKFSTAIELFRFFLPAYLHIGIGASSFLYLLFLPDTFSLFIWLTLIVAVADSSAYFVGKKFGKTPLIPVISPNKTIEGLAAGIICSVFVGFMTFSLLTESLPVLCILVFCLIVPFSALIGDLNVSYLKRLADVKDTGSILPGHGGLLDRIDAILATTIWMVFFVLFQGM